MLETDANLVKLVWKQGAEFISKTADIVKNAGENAKKAAGDALNTIKGIFSKKTDL